MTTIPKQDELVALCRAAEQRGGPTVLSRLFQDHTPNAAQYGSMTPAQVAEVWGGSPLVRREFMDDVESFAAYVRHQALGRQVDRERAGVA